MKLGEGLVRVLGKDEKLGMGKSFESNREAQR
jgi:hypothetical protein